MISGPVVPHRVDRGLVDQVGQVGAGEAGSAPGDHGQVHVRGQLLAPAVHGQDRGALGQVGQRHDRPAGRTARAAAAPGRAISGRLVAAITTTPGGLVEAVHLRQQLVQRLLALVVGHHRRRRPPRRWPMASISSMKMIDGRALARLGEQVTDPGRADADEQLHERWTR